MVDFRRPGHILCIHAVILMCCVTTIYTEAYRPLHTSGQPVAADKEIQEQLREHVVRTTGVEVGTVLGDLKVLAAHSFLHLLLAICGDLVK